MIHLYPTLLLLLCLLGLVSSIKVVITELDDQPGTYDDRDEEQEEVKLFRIEPSVLFGNPTPGGPPSIGQALSMGGGIPQVI